MKTFKELFTKLVIKKGSCWFWNGSIEDQGYGIVWFQGMRMKAHRFSYELYKGDIPEKFEVDHLCKNRNCVNPEHLEAVSKKENILRGEGPTAQNARRTHCKRGHPFDLFGKPKKGGGRECRLCKRMHSRIWAEKAKLMRSQHQ